jgi:hypothetical protein
MRRPHMKRRIPLFVILSIVVVILALGCRLPFLGQPGSQLKGTSFSVDVRLNAGADRASRSLIGDTNVDTVSIEVLSSKAGQIGLGNLVKMTSYWSGKISVSETGLVTFNASAMDVNSAELYFGTTDVTLTGSNDPPVTIPMTQASGYYFIGGTGPAGGLVFYDKGSYSDGWRYLEAAPNDQSTGIQWYNGEGVTTGASGTAVGTGAANTASIVATQGAGTYAAQLCADLVVGSYDDWFLPSKDELNLMYVNLEQQSRGGFASAYYWSSSEYNLNNSWTENLGNGGQIFDYKGNAYNVRAARVF